MFKVYTSSPWRARGWSGSGYRLTFERIVIPGDTNK